MTPRVLNNELLAGEFFYVTHPDWPDAFHRQLIVKKAKTVTKQGVRKVKVLTDAGWLYADKVRRAGSFSWLELDGEGPLTWYLN